MPWAKEAAIMLLKLITYSMNTNCGVQFKNFPSFLSSPYSNKKTTPQMLFSPNNLRYLFSSLLLISRKVLRTVSIFNFRRRKKSSKSNVEFGCSERLPPRARARWRQVWWNIKRARHRRHLLLFLLQVRAFRLIACEWEMCRRRPRETWIDSYIRFNCKHIFSRTWKQMGNVRGEHTNWVQNEFKVNQDDDESAWELNFISL